MSKLFNAVDKAIKEVFASYAVVDSNGTRQLTYTLKGAKSWLPYCASDRGTCVISRKKKQVVLRYWKSNDVGHIYL
jgi:hypothetical protein